MPLPRRFVYILKNSDKPPRYYTGLTGDVPTRLSQHYDGRGRHTANGAPWRLDVVIEFVDESRAARFEQYLKSGSGWAFANRHFRSRSQFEQRPRGSRVAGAADDVCRDSV
jgi:predicted GIY-YIG superfamily endonuclease